MPGADDVVTAPVASLELPAVSEPVTSGAPITAAPAPTTERPTSSEAPAASTAPATTVAPAATEPAAETAPDDDVFLRLGDEGPEVATMQAKLASIEYLPAGSDTGVFDETTRAGLRQFQADYGLGVDGIFGPITGRALNAAVSSINVDS